MRLNLAKDPELLPNQSSNQVRKFEGTQTNNQVRNLELSQTGNQSSNLEGNQTCNQSSNLDRDQTGNQSSNFEHNKSGGNPVLSQLDVSEKGSVDAGLTLIPTTIFFLVLLQVILAGSWQVVERAKLHDLLIRESISAGAPTTAGSSFNKPSENRSLDTNQNAGNETLITRKRTSEYGDIYEYLSEKKVPIFGALLESFGVTEFKIKLSAIRVE